jgi:hypothetical protein
MYKYVCVCVCGIVLPSLFVLQTWSPLSGVTIATSAHHSCALNATLAFECEWKYGRGNDICNISEEIFYKEKCDALQL